MVARMIFFRGGGEWQIQGCIFSLEKMTTLFSRRRQITSFLGMHFFPEKNDDLF